MTELVLVRHAATAWSGRRYCGRSDPSLSRAGLFAARTIAERLHATLPPGIRVVSSPRRRAVQTARAIAAALGTRSVQLDERWAETDFGLFEGLTFDQLSLAAPDLARRLTAGDTDIDWPGGERSASLAARVEAAWRDVTSDDRAAVVVTHGGPIRVAIALETGRPPATVAIPEPGGIWRSGSDAPSDRHRVRTAG